MPKKAREKKVEETKAVEKVSKEVFEKRVLELAEKGFTSEKIGEMLRKEGIHSKEFGQKISKILGSKYTSPDLKNIQVKLEKIQKHYATNKKDRRAMREQVRVAAQLQRLKKYSQ